MQDQTPPDLFPTVLRRPASLLWVVVLPSFLLALVNAFSFWLVWGEMKETSQRAYALTLLATSLLPALAGLGAILWVRRKADGSPAWVNIVPALLCLVHLLSFCWLFDDAMPRGVPEWIIGPSFFLAQFACMMPGLFTGVWRIACMRLNVRPLADFGLSLAATFIPPALLYFGMFVASHFVSWSRADSLLRPLFIAGMVAGPILFFLGLLRCLMLARRFFVQKGEKSRALHVGYIGCVALVLPIAGLLLNKKIPFPADFQNLWPYVLTVLNAVFLMMPETGKRWADALVRAMRLALFPFTFYFFVVFLPFLPLSILAILAMGTGFLILAPTLLFMVHGQILKRDYEQQKAAGAGRFALGLRMALCLLALPLGIAARAELDRAALHRTLDFRYATNYRCDATLSVSPARVRRVLLNVRRFKDGAELPYITNWYNWRVFDNMLLQDEKAEDLWRLIVGGEPPQPAKEDFSRNIFASLFGGKTRSPERRFGGVQRPIPRNVALSDVQSAYATTNGETETRVTLKVTSHDTASQAEYFAKLKVPPGVWVSGFKLKIGDKWEDGRVIERKAAEWVYRQIRDVSRRDPAILRYDDEDTLTLRVFPVAPDETREVEIDFLCPEGLADAVTVGERRVALGNGTAKPLCAWADGVFVRNSAWRPPGEACVTPQLAVHLILDCSAGAVWTAENVSNSLNMAQAVLGLRVRNVLLANYERRLVAASAQGIQGGMLPSRGSFDVATALRMLAFDSRMQSFREVGPHTVQLPRIVLAGHSVRAALDAVKPAEWRAVRDEWPLITELLVMDERGKVAPFVLPNSMDDVSQTAVLSLGCDVRLCVGSGADKIVFIHGDGEPKLLLMSFEAERCAPVPGLAEMPQDSRWAKGAAAWRLQRELEENPARDHLRRDILAASRESGVLTPGGAYIVVENSMQWKMLEVKQRQTLAGDAALDLVESPAPRAWLLVALGLLMLVFFRMAAFSKKGTVPKRKGKYDE